MEKTRGSLRVLVEKVKFLTGDSYNPWVTVQFGAETKQTPKMEDVKADVYYNDRMSFEVNGDEELKAIVSVHSSGFFGDKALGQTTLGLDMYFQEKETKQKVINKIYDGNDVTCEVTLVIEFCYSFIGVMHVKVLKADLTRDTEVFGKMDPYVVLQLGAEQKKQTSVKGNAGKNPVWDETYGFDLMNLFDPLHVWVWDEEVGDADPIGEGVCEFKPMAKAPQTYEVVLAHKGEAAGKLFLEISFSK
jgi:hypothetical protein